MPNGGEPLEVKVARLEERLSILPEQGKRLRVVEGKLNRLDELSVSVTKLTSAVETLEVTIAPLQLASQQAGVRAAGKVELSRGVKVALISLGSAFVLMGILAPVLDHWLFKFVGLAL